MNGPQYGLGYVLHKDWWRQCLVSEATAELMKFDFGEQVEVVLRAQHLVRPADGRDAQERVGEAGSLSDGAYSP